MAVKAGDKVLRLGTGQVSTASPVSSMLLVDGQAADLGFVRHQGLEPRTRD
jgi:hypothetical protein